MKYKVVDTCGSDVWYFDDYSSAMAFKNSLNSSNGGYQLGSTGADRYILCSC
jgi:hypothetical protein